MSDGAPDLHMLNVVGFSLELDTAVGLMSPIDDLGGLCHERGI